MPTKVLLCDTPDGLAQLQYALMKSGAALELEVVTDGFRAVEVAARTQPEIVVTEIGFGGVAGAGLVPPPGGPAPPRARPPSAASSRPHSPRCPPSSNRSRARRPTSWPTSRTSSGR